ncbi:MAG: hypothetical protein AVDCRST_MAG41-2318, partial [uncultured Corynebacteriales bacterium]
CIRVNRCCTAARSRAARTARSAAAGSSRPRRRTSTTPTRPVARIAPTTTIVTTTTHPGRKPATAVRSLPTGDPPEPRPTDRRRGGGTRRPGGR